MSDDKERAIGAKNWRGDNVGVGIVDAGRVRRRRRCYEVAGRDLEEVRLELELRVLLPVDGTVLADSLRYTSVSVMVLSFHNVRARAGARTAP